MSGRRVRPTIVIVIVLAIVSIDWTWASLLQVTNITPRPTSHASGFLYWVPESALKDPLPTDVGDVSSCSPELTTWLNLHGSAVLTPQVLIITNPSDRTLMVSFGSQPSRQESGAARGFYVQCGVPQISVPTDYTVPGGRRWETVTVNIAPFGAADYALAHSDDNSEQITDYRLTLKPGEQVGMTIALQGAIRFNGAVVLRTGLPGSPAVPIPILQGDHPSLMVAWPGVPPWSTILVHPYKGALYCITPGVRDAGGVCSPSGIRTMVDGYRGAIKPSAPLASLPLLAQPNITSSFG